LQIFSKKKRAIILSFFWPAGCEISPKKKEKKNTNFTGEMWPNKEISNDHCEFIHLSETQE
jgi:hypothetical protein